MYNLFLFSFLFLRVTVVSMNDQKQPIYRETSGIKQASLGKNEMVTMLELDPVLTVFPLLLSFNFCVSTPLITPQLDNNEIVEIEDDEWTKKAKLLSVDVTSAVILWIILLLFEIESIIIIIVKKLNIV